MANDRDITLGQLFALKDSTSKDKLLLQWVHDIGDWWSHSISVTKHEEEGPADATVAHLLSGTGGSIPENIGGIQKFYLLMLRLTGKFPLGRKERKGNKCNADPSSEEWRELFNNSFRSKPNRSHFLAGPITFNLEQARADLETELRRPRPKNSEVGNVIKIHPSSGLAYDMGRKCTVASPRKATDVCAYCGVTVALRKCSGKIAAELFV